MKRCVADDNPNCFYECEGDTCVAFYEPETELCIRGCDGKLLGVGMVLSVARKGWEVRTTADVRGITGHALALAAEQIRAMAEIPRRVTPFRGSPGQIVDVTSTIINLLAEPEFRSQSIDISWRTMSLFQSLEEIRQVVSARPATLT